VPNAPATTCPSCMHGPGQAWSNAPWPLCDDDAPSLESVGVRSGTQCSSTGYRNGILRADLTVSAW
jgi:hypothetical protein